MENVDQEIVEGLAKIKTKGKVFYNPVQEFNRDLSILVLSTFTKQFLLEKESTKNGKIKENIIINKDHNLNLPQAGLRYENGISILEALSATGLRSIRYAKEILGVKQIIANDISKKAVEDIERNVKDNNVDNVVTPKNDDAVMLMYKHRRENQFDAIDLDPYGCPSIFLDSAVQAIADGGLLLVTATDMAVLCGNSPETCYVKYGSVSLKIKSCHEMAIRILLQCIESHCNRYSRYIVPLLSISADFYIRVFLRVYTGAHKCKFTTSKLSMVHHCTGCDAFNLQPLGILKKNEKCNQVKFSLPVGPPVRKTCEHCGGSHHMGGPIWSAPLHSKDFVNELILNLPKNLKTNSRIDGVLNVIKEELDDVPLYYTLEKLSGTLHIETPPMMAVRSAILNAGYKVSYTHMCKSSIKTDAPSKVIWDIMRCWTETHPINPKRLLVDSPASNILKIKPEKQYSFDMHSEANPESKKMGLVRFQQNPLPYWGPGTRATAMCGDEKMSKSIRNQGKRKRDDCSESLDEVH